jgi:DNA-binding MarR family transcriptional regulator
MFVSDSATVRLAEDIGRSCLNMRARIVSRVVTGIYDEELRPLGIQASQLNLLVAVAGMGPVRRTDVGRYMHLDASTITRNLRVMETNGWIEEIADPSDGRGGPIRITRRGEALLARAAPAWRSAQRKASKHLGKNGKAALMQLSAAITT